MFVATKGELEQLEVVEKTLIEAGYTRAPADVPTEKFAPKQYRFIEVPIDVAGNGRQFVLYYRDDQP